MSSSVPRVPKRIHGLEISPELRARLKELQQRNAEPVTPKLPARPARPRRPKPSSTWEMEAMIRLGYKSLTEMWADQFPPGSREGLKRELAKQFGVSVDTIRRCIREAGLSPYERDVFTTASAPMQGPSVPEAEPQAPARRSVLASDASQTQPEPAQCVQATVASRTVASRTVMFRLKRLGGAAVSLMELEPGDVERLRRFGKLTDEELAQWQAGRSRG